MADPKKQAKNRTDAATPPLARILAALPDARRSGAGWIARCPAHDDATPSLSISGGDDGRTLIRCHAGCSAEAVTAALGMTMSALMPPRDAVPMPRRSAPPAKKPNRTYPTMTAAADAALVSMRRVEGRADWIIAAVHEYRRTDGDIYAAVVRAEPPGGGEKDIRPIHAAPGGWAVGDPDAWTPYRADALQPGTIFVVEGEKAADAGAGIGMDVVTWAHGAKAVSRTDWSAMAGRDVALMPDHDTAGRAAMNELAAILTALRCDVRVLMLDGLAEHGDLADWLAERDAHEPHELLDTLTKRAEAAPKWEPSAEAGENPTAGLIVRCANDIVTREVRWLWRNRFVDAAINLLCGMPDCGKSVLTCDIASRVSAGRDWPMIGGSRETVERGSVIFLVAEDSPETTAVPRLQVAGADLSRVHFVEGVNIIGSDGQTIRDAFDVGRDVEHLEALRKRLGDLRLVVVDPLDSYLNAKVDTNIGNKVRAALWPLKDWAESQGVAIIIVHHFNKGATVNAMDRVSGARSFGALPRSVWAAGRDENSDRTILAPVKLNLVAQADKQSIAYTIESCATRPGVPVIRWEADHVLTSASELLGAKSARKGEVAADWLRELLTANGPMAGKDILAQAREAGHSERTIHRVKDDIGVRVEQIREGGKIGGWKWTL